LHPARPQQRTVQWIRVTARPGEIVWTREAETNRSRIEKLNTYTEGNTMNELDYNDYLTALYNLDYPALYVPENVPFSVIDAALADYYGGGEDE